MAIAAGPGLCAPRPAVTAVDAVAGRPVLIPLRLEPGEAAPARLTARLDGERYVGVAVERIEATPIGAGCGGPGWMGTGWIGPGVGLAARPVRPGDRQPEDPEAAGGAIRWLGVAAAVPPGTPSLVIEGRSVAIRWLEEPYAEASRLGVLALGGEPGWGPGSRGGRAQDDPFASPTPPDLRRDAGLAEAMRPVLNDPARHWRLRLSVDALRPRDPGLPLDPAIRPGGGGALGGGEPDGVDWLIDLEAAKWQVVLLRLWKLDPELAARARAALAGAVRFPGALGSGGTAGGSVESGASGALGVVAPVWLAGEDRAGQLRALMLEGDPLASDRAGATAEAVEAWLAGVPGGAAWVIDDAGSALGAPSIGVVNLGPGATLASASGVGGWARVASPLPLGPWASGVVALDASAAGPVSLRRAVLGAAVHIGTWRGGVEVLSPALLAAPPGLLTGRFFTDWTMPVWASGGVPGQTDSIARIERRPIPDGSGGHGVHGGRRGGEAWAVVFEGRFERPVGGGEINREAEWLELYFGPTAAPGLVLRVYATGRMERVGGGWAGGGGVGGGEVATWTPVAPEADRWVAVVPIPGWAIEAGGRLRVGMVRVEACGRRSAWPRPMLPWQAAPGRAGVDLGGWGGVATEGG